jgi:uncharacterized protein
MMKIEGPVILTYSGRYVEPLDLKVEDVALEDIAHALSNQCRYSGHTRRFYSVAEHSCRVADLLAQRYGSSTALAGLLHDASEAYLIDLPTPLKQSRAIGLEYQRAERAAMKVVADRFDLPHEFEKWPEVKVADLRLLATERRDLMPANGEWAILGGVEPLETLIFPWSNTDAETEFLIRFNELVKVAA